MKTKSFAILLIALSMGCLHRGGWLQHQDSRILMPDYHAIVAGGGHRWSYVSGAPDRRQRFLPCMGSSARMHRHARGAQVLRRPAR